MKVVVRDEQKGMYCGPRDGWVPSADEAQEFASVQDAGERARSEPGRELSVVLVYENPCCELKLNPVYCV